MSPIYVPGKVVLKKDGVAATDTNIREVSLLLHGDGANGSTTITDSSLTPKTVTAVGNAQISTAQSKFGGASIAFDGTGDYLAGVTSQADDFNLPGNFTIESWIYLNSTSGTQTIAGKWATGQQAWIFQTTNTSLLIATGNSGTFSTLSSASTTWAPSTWYHVGATRSEGNIFLFRNGVLLGTSGNTANATSANTTSVIYAGMNQDGSQQLFNGYIDDLRITKGVARYTANFTPPTLPFPDF
jgi:hypothetical protein